MNSRLNTTRRTNKKRKWLRVLLYSFLFLFIIAGVYFFSVYNSLTEAVDTMHHEIDRKKSDKRSETVSLKTADPISVLLLGVDQRDGDRGRSDSMIVLTVNPEAQSVKMVSIPRDTRTEIVGKGKQDKINHAYAFGGVEMSLATVENFLDIPIDYVIQINMEGFKDIVDSVGGVTVQNEFAFTHEGTNFPKGELKLNGDKALKYSRMRYEDPTGDVGRQQRQRQIIQGVINEGASLSTLANYGDIFKALGNNVKTNLTFDEMMTIQSQYKEASKSIEQISITGQGTTINNVYYLQVPTEEKNKIQNLLKQHLEL
ncbi:polyisoprenyl-teichoic acid--peptidoglycan teichoic acid transferase TagU [Bacillus sp. T33-2]|uniref:polyisoprenyl-teichoic acid--peptidoglycan teichoic acid transferase TagU n=1 Tax=Bacillus sp. T33-2 TaxID=2054168 RepID=UPI000C78E5B7|nr:LytR family transcriptional regulator [Bacillus sp. T33-2]PLR90763.1 LytR family transcriptional regulator [Bacillus sp. T33-2]